MCENKPNSNPIQSQYKPNLPDAKMSVNSILTKDYEKNDIFAVPENKPNSNPIKPNLETTPGLPDRVSSIKHQVSSIEHPFTTYQLPFTSYLIRVTCPEHNRRNLWLKNIFLIIAFISWMWY